MHLNNVATILIAILVFGSCSKGKNGDPDNENKLNRVVITSIDYVNSMGNEVTTEYDYIYDKNFIKEIRSAGKRHISFDYHNDKVVSKRYFNNLEDLINIETFSYNNEDKLELINVYNGNNELILIREISYTWDKLSSLKETFLYPKTSIQEYDFIYSGLTIDSVIFSTVNQTYVYEYTDEANIQSLDFYIKNMGLYQGGLYGINGITLPIIFSPKSIKSFRGYDSTGSQLFEFNYDHFISDGQYDAIHFQYYDQDYEILNSTEIDFIY